MKLISIVSPMYNESGNIEQYFKRVNAIAEQIKASITDIDFEIVIVNDGSKDDTLAKLVDMQKVQGNLRVVNLSRNFGVEPALFAGVKHAKGDALIIMDADMQDPPEVIKELIEKWQEGFDVVNAKRVDRSSDSFMKRKTAKMYYKLINKLSHKVKYPADVNNFRLISRRVADVINTFGSSGKFFRNAVAQAGFKTTEVGFKRAPRTAGETSFNAKSLLGAGFSGVADVSVKPLNLGFKMSIWFLFLGGFVCAGALTFGILNECGIGWAVTVCSSMLFGMVAAFFAIMLFTGIVLLILGITNFYLGRTYTDVRGMPMFIVAHVYEPTGQKQSDT